MAVTFAAVVITFLANKPWFFKYTWPVVSTFIDAKEIVNLTGKWEGHIFSNFLVHKKVHDYCIQKSPKAPLDNWHPSDPDDFFKLQRYSVKLSIEMSYAAINVTMRVLDDEGMCKSTSYTVASSAEIIIDGQHRFGRIAYVYKSKKSNEKFDIESEDDKEHYGSAQLDIIMNGRTVVGLQGTYWTKRNWDKGRNTGGRMDLSKSAS